jgi:hypothetical protein
MQFDSLQRLVFFSSLKCLNWPRTPLNLSNGYGGRFFLPLKRPSYEADHSSLSSAKVKNAWSSTSTECNLMACCLIKNREIFTLSSKAWSVLYPRLTTHALNPSLCGEKSVNSCLSYGNAWQTGWHNDWTNPMALFPWVSRINAISLLRIFTCNWKCTCG